MGMESGVKIEGDEIVIRIPIAAIPHAAARARDESRSLLDHQLALGHHLQVRVLSRQLAQTIEMVDFLGVGDHTAAALFAEELLRELTRKREDGATPIDRLLEKAIIECINLGAQLEELALLALGRRVPNKVRSIAGAINDAIPDDADMFDVSRAFGTLIGLRARTDGSDDARIARRIEDIAATATGVFLRGLPQ